MKKRLAFLLAALLALTLLGCGSRSTPETASTELTEIQTEPGTEPLPEIQTEPIPETQPGEKPVCLDPEAGAAFRAALERMMDERIFPDGSQVIYVADYGDMEDNRFAILDVDGDGLEELLIAYSTVYMGGMQTHVYGYDRDSGDLRRQLLEAPGLYFYEGGLVRADASHNHTLAGDTFWPRQMYGYDPETDTYEKSVFLDAWDRSMAEVNYDGDPFPEDMDRENAGIVYLIYQGEWGGEHETLSKTDFETWLDGCLGDAQPMIIPYCPMTEENIAALTD